jgi:hypothetical protein
MPLDQVSWGDVFGHTLVGMLLLDEASCFIVEEGILSSSERFRGSFKAFDILIRVVRVWVRPILGGAIGDWSGSHIGRALGRGAFCSWKTHTVSPS